MIQRLQLRNWRAYDSLDLELGPGATFVVASNGIGKTSLVMGASWGIFGDVAGVKGADEIRGEAESATVVVELVLPSGARLEITRTVDRKGRTELTAVSGDRTVDDLDDLLSSEFGADSRVLAQLTFMIHGGSHESQGEFELRDHLAGLFGVRPLFEAASRADALASETAATLRKTKIVERGEQRKSEDLRADVATAERALQTAQATRDAAVEKLDAAAETLRVATEWTNYRAALGARDAKLAAYAASAAALLDREVAPDDVLTALAQLEEDQERSLAQAEADVAAARARATLVKESIERLSDADATCPTCLRPFGEHDAERAAEEHARHLAELDATIAEATELATSRRALLTNLKRVLADIRSVPMPVTPATAEPDAESEATRAAHDTARDEVRRLEQDAAEKGASLRELQSALASIDEDSAHAARLEELFRLEALAIAGARTFRETAGRVMEQHIEPLVTEVARRWKQTFGREGLQLSADGRITRKVGTRTLPFGALSGGERVWALLVVRLLVTAASTRTPFVWLDEPLEHLDPRLRRIVAGTLAMASSGGGLRQVIVTTYEAPIAQQLMEDVPSASLLYVTSAD